MPNLFTPERLPGEPFANYKARRNQAKGRAQAMMRGIYSRGGWAGTTDRDRYSEAYGRRQGLKRFKTARRAARGRP